MFENTVSVEERKEDIESRKKDDDDNVKSFWKRCNGQLNYYFQTFKFVEKGEKMTASNQEKTAKKLFRFFVPKIDNFGQDIPKERRDDFINVIQTECCKNKNNGGYTKFEAKGGYMSDSGKIMEEDITVIETYGENPLPPERMARCSKYMAQESLIVMSVGNYEFKDYKGGVDYTKYKLPKPKKSSADLLKAIVRGIQNTVSVARNSLK
ncbi:MAG: hypothetical protein EHM85_05650 [Desulfobacteraceae bacterium]|nr:MAG: hypothetical protein EHM85_05650 [Desulfobacteraceae bacterium]